jgi:hypothetical protein
MMKLVHSEFSVAEVQLRESGSLLHRRTAGERDLHSRRALKCECFESKNRCLSIEKGATDVSVTANEIKSKAAAMQR